MKNANNLRLLVNPFTRIAGWQAFSLGLLIVLITAIVGSFSNIIYPAVLDVKINFNVELVDAIILSLVSAFTYAIVAYLFTLFFAKQTRFIDILGISTLARAPLFFTSFFGFFVNEESMNETNAKLLEGTANANILEFLSSIAGVLAIGLAMVPFIVWYVALLFFGYRVATGVDTKKCTLFFILAIVVSEILSIILNVLIFR